MTSDPSFKQSNNGRPLASNVKDRIIRMHKAATDRLHDADILCASFDARSDSQSLLRVLAFEVLLKAALLSSGNGTARGHK